MSIGRQGLTARLYHLLTRVSLLQDEGEKERGRRRRSGDGLEISARLPLLLPHSTSARDKSFLRVRLTIIEVSNVQSIKMDLESGIEA